MDAGKIKEIIEYEPETGFLYWKPRERHHFSCAPHLIGRALSSWNAQYAGKKITSKSPYGHIIVHINLGKRWRTGGHRAAWAIHYGYWPNGVVDHINGDPSDNRICNLRDCTLSQNSRNQKISKRNTSGKVGVTFYNRTQQWRAWIRIKGKTISLGYHETKEAAIAARIAAENLHGFFEATRLSEEEMR